MYFSLRNRLFLIFTCLLTVPIVILSFIIPSWFTSFIKEQAQDFSIEMMDQYSLYVDSITSQAEDLGKQVLVSQTTQQWLRDHSEVSYIDGERSVRNNQIRNLLTSMRINNSNGMSISVYLHDGTGVEGNHSALNDMNWYIDFMENGQSYVKSHIDPYEQPSVNSHVNSFILPLFNVDTLVQGGIIKVNFPTELLETALSNIAIGQSARGYLIDENGANVLQGTIETPTEVLSDSLSKITSDANDRGLVETNYNGENYFIFFQKLSVGNWILISEITESDLFAQVNQIQLNLLLTSGIAFLLTLVASYMFSTNITSPLGNLAKAMGYMERGDFSGAKKFIPTIKSQNDEVGYLVRVFDQTIDKLKNMIETEYEANLRRKDAEYKALLLQINPHFLNNTLEIIGGLAVQGENQKVMNVSVYLGKMMRYSLDTKSNIVKLGEELNYIRSYTEILKLRYEDTIFVQVEEDPETKGISIIKFILQPLVENAVKYSFREKEYAEIYIKTKINSNQLIIVVEDKGIGMSEKVIKDLMAHQENNNETSNVLDSKGTSIGLKNVLGRLKLYYGEDFSYKIETKNNVGTKIILNIQLKRRDLVAEGHDNG
ncbi:two-component system sensor histidine kinase YesM [Evansella vedderi]|uniref:Two-component system sensor histidine kinase YesM n=1 Tax=Evansella vedderi TaxID=38282 RepID=A0ABU0A3Z5_9BACI|nr:sensor histidine kinase [Evansella vedderi]MDQ0257065.1 two-component system sensor histidine kinase YesM [Evansella vedderi]